MQKKKNIYIYIYIYLQLYRHESLYAAVIHVFCRSLARSGKKEEKKLLDIFV